MGQELWSARHVAQVTGLSIGSVSKATKWGTLKGVSVKNGDGPARHVYRPAAVRQWIRDQMRTNVVQRAVFTLANVTLKNAHL